MPSYADDPFVQESRRRPQPYVTTPQGYRRKIGPKSKYGVNDGNDGDRPVKTRLGSTPSRLGSAMPATESNFSASMRNAGELSRANAVYEDRFNRRAKEIEANKPKPKAPVSKRLQTGIEWIDDLGPGQKWKPMQSDPDSTNKGKESFAAGAKRFTSLARGARP